MPTVAIVAGMAIRFYYDDHEPAHFHVHGASFAARILIADGTLLDSQGSISARESRLLRDWALRHRSALLDNWARARGRRPLKKIGE